MEGLCRRRRQNFGPSFLSSHFFSFLLFFCLCPKDLGGASVGGSMAMESELSIALVGRRHRADFGHGGHGGGGGVFADVDGRVGRRESLGVDVVIRAEPQQQRPRTRRELAGKLWKEPQKKVLTHVVHINNHKIIACRTC